MDMNAILYAVLILGALGVVFGLALSFADKRFAVPVDEKVAKIREAVAGANCGACGYPGCDGFAKAVAEGKAPADGCTPGGAKTAKAIAEIMGVTVKEEDPVVAKVLCQGTCEVAKQRYDYQGPQSCRLAHTMAGGLKQCQFACMGLGDCVRVCKFGALSIKDGIAVIDKEKCTACGACVKACPRGIIRLLPRKSLVTVRCRNTAPAKDANAACEKSCIGCRRCVKACQFDAIHVDNQLAVIDPEKCTGCGACAEVCPHTCITNEGGVA